MKRLLVCLLLGVVGCGKSEQANEVPPNEAGKQANQVDPNQEANGLFVEAMKLIESAESKSGEAAIRDYERAMSNVQEIIDDYSKSDLAVKLISGETLFRGRTLADIRKTLALTKEQVEREQPVAEEPITEPARPAITENSRRESYQEAAWREYFFAIREIRYGRQNTDWLNDLITQGPQDGFDAPNLFKGTHGRLPRLWAFQFIADHDLATGSLLIYSDRDEARVRLLAAMGHYEHILESATSRDGLLQQRALLGQAATAESLMACNPALSDQKHYYGTAQQALRKLRQLDIDSATKELARQRSEMLKRLVANDDGETVQDDNFFRWLALFEPKILPAQGELLPPPVLNAPLPLP